MHSNHVAPSTRAQVITRRTYNRPLDEVGGVFETWEQTVDRVIGHQRWLWERAADRSLNTEEEAELEELRSLMESRKVSTSGRTLWLGGTDIAKKREASQFNCSFLRIETVSDIADAFWLLLQGCGVGFEPITGVLNGFASVMEVEVIPSTRTDKGGRETNKETLKKGVWTISVGDSAMAWSKAVAKMMAGKRKARKLVLDFSEIRPPGLRLTGYGWISSGHEPFAKAMVAIADLMNERIGKILSRIDILDILNIFR
jgi:ribonucleoside-triphosphate reductase